MSELTTIGPRLHTVAHEAGQALEGMAATLDQSARHVVHAGASGLEKVLPHRRRRSSCRPVALAIGAVVLVVLVMRMRRSQEGGGQGATPPEHES